MASACLSAICFLLDFLCFKNEFWFLEELAKLYGVHKPALRGNWNKNLEECRSKKARESLHVGFYIYIYSFIFGNIVCRFWTIFLTIQPSFYKIRSICPQKLDTFFSTLFKITWKLQRINHTSFIKNFP